jgi:hypothetical protein
VKALHLNLASRPYRDYGPFTIVASVALALIAVLAYFNVDTYLEYKSKTKVTAAKIDELERQIVDEKTRAEAATQRLRTVDVKFLAQQTDFVNARLAERAFSWSELLDRLEHVMPDDVRIGTVSPSFSKDGLVHLTLDCTGKATDSMVRMIDGLNHDTHFVAPFPSGEQKQQSGEYSFTLTVAYRPSIMRVLE